MEKEKEEKNYSTKCPECGKEGEYTGLPDIAGEIQFRFFRCYIWCSQSVRRSWTRVNYRINIFPAH